MTAIAKEHQVDTAGSLTGGQKMLPVLFSCFGWAFDMFDLFIFLYTAPILAHVFFGSAGSMLALAGVYAAFTTTLLMRPLGGVLFGQLSDRRGRKLTMSVTTIGMGIATALTGAIPSLAAIGVAAPILFITLRLIHGVFMGGVVASTHTLGTESISPRWRGLASGIITGGGSALGKLSVSLLFLLVTAIFPGHAFDEWGWRVLFFTGITSSVLGLLVFTRLQESPMWLEAQARKSAQPHAGVRALVAERYLGTLGVCILLTTAGSGMTYLTSGYLPTVLRLVNKLGAQELGIILSVAAVAGGIASVLSGLITDLIGRKRGVYLFGGLALIGVPLLYLQLPHLNGWFSLAACAFALTSLMTFCYAPILIVLNERFATAVRATGTAVAWNTGYALGGSTTVLISLLSKSPAQLPHALALATAMLAALYLVSSAVLGGRRGEMGTS